MAGINIKVQVKGYEKLLKQLETFANADELLKEISRSQFARANRILNVALRLVPVDFGTLKRSGTVGTPVIEGNKVTTEISFGGPAAPYAVFVHEDLDAEHKVGQAKYLEIPMLSDRDGYLDDLRKLINEMHRRKAA